MELQTAYMKSLRAALKLLLEFSDEHPDQRVSDLANRTGLTKSHVSKLLSDFANAGLLIQNPVTRSYSVDQATFVLGTRFINNDRLVHESTPIMRMLMDTTGHSARLSVLDKMRILYLLCIEGPLFVDTGIRTGTWLPLHSTSAGRVLLAFQETERIEVMLGRSPLKKLTNKTVVDKKKLNQILASVRSNGYACQRGETTQDLAAISAPVFGEHQKVLAALTVATPTHLLTGDVEVALVGQLQDAARGISLRMGCRVYPYGSADRGTAMYLRAIQKRAAGRVHKLY